MCRSEDMQMSGCVDLEKKIENRTFGLNHIKIVVRNQESGVRSQ